MRDENGPGWILKWVTLSKRQTSTVPLTQVRRYQFHEAEACGREGEERMERRRVESGHGLATEKRTVESVVED